MMTQQVKRFESKTLFRISPMELRAAADALHALMCQKTGCIRILFAFAPLSFTFDLGY